ncbi:MAG: DUF547 domain-containing protein [Nitrospirota bacterium]|nr:DUF547 domain-containing protein [Nitrospirota bacterium]MDH5699263.1 DUF547 domain-containing protein [Nitrospirota bacterium]
MHIRMIWFLLTVFLMCGFLGCGQTVLANEFSNWDVLLKMYVAPKTIEGIPLYALNYQALGKDPLYKTVIADLEKASVSVFKTQEEKLAFWINAYNIMAVKMVLDHYPVKSIKDAGGLLSSVWKLNVGTVGGKERTLNEIEHDILRKMGEPRIHVAIVCASLSCPDIRPEAYTPERLHEQLDDQMKAFLANPQKGLQVDESKQRLYLSSIFKWFAEDFEAKGGVRQFLAKYVPERLSAYLKNDTFRMSYLDYNWNLNEVK